MRFPRKIKNANRIKIDINFDAEAHEDLRILIGDGVRLAVSAVARRYRIRSAEVAVLVTDDAGIREINRTQRGIDSATDVLSFPQYESLRDVKSADFLHLGDIVLSLETAMRQADEYGHSPRREVCYLATHSMLHLLGYDHMNEHDKFLMRAAEKSIMKEIEVFKTNE